MIASRIIRILRKRIVLGIIFVVSLIYCLASIVLENQTGDAVETDTKPILRPGVEFKWYSDNNNTTGKILNCRNSVQGKVLITDDKGYICSRSDVQSTGCCNTEAVKTQRYSCNTCKPNGCCNIYEFCIACCLHPDKKHLLQTVLGKAAETFSILFSSVTDHFELCLAKCRTSSQSVQHENSYRDPKSKYCYGDSPPFAQPATH